MSQQTDLEDYMLKRLASLEAEIKTNSEMTRRIEAAVCGDEKMGHHGLAVEVAKLKIWRASLQRQIAYLTGAMAVIMFALYLARDLFVEWIKLKINGGK